MSARVGCPYCNHKVVLAAVPATGRAVCDRCGETFPLTGAVEEVADPAPAEPWLPFQPEKVTPMRVAAAAVLLLIVAVPVVIGLVALSRQPFPPPPAAKQPTGPVTWPPSAVPLLQHLPPDTGIAIAVQPGPLLAHAQRTGADPQKLLAGLGVPERVFATLTDLGLSLDRLDQFAGGLVFPPDNAFPRVVLAVKLTGPPGDLLDRLKAVRDGKRYRVVVGGLPLRLEERPGVWVFATADADLDRPPAAGSSHFTEGLRGSLAQLSPAAFAWAATDSADWASKPTMQLAAKAVPKADLLDRLKLGRAAAVGLSLEPDLRAAVAVKAAGDEKALQERIAAAVAGNDVRIGGGDGWVTLSAKPEDVPALLAR